MNDKVISGTGNGSLDGVSNALKQFVGNAYELETYSQHAMDEGSDAKAASYVGLRWHDGTVTWGAGMDNDIITAGVRALVSAINNHSEERMDKTSWR